LKRQIVAIQVIEDAELQGHLSDHRHRAHARRPATLPACQNEASRQTSKHP
jgi:hypothetical protein